MYSDGIWNPLPFIFLQFGRFIFLIFWDKVQARDYWAFRSYAGDVCTNSTKKTQTNSQNLKHR